MGTHNHLDVTADFIQKVYYGLLLPSLYILGGNRVQTAIKTALPYSVDRYNISSPVLKFYNLRYKNIKFTCSTFMYILFIHQVKIIG